MSFEFDFDGGTDELMIKIPVFSSDDAFGNEHATEEHSGQKVEPILEEELDLVGV